MRDFLEIPRFLDASGCAAVRAELSATPGDAAPLLGSEVRIEVRRTRRFAVPPAAASRITPLFGEAMGALERHFGVALTHFEPPQFLRYGPGDFFVARNALTRAEHPSGSRSSLRAWCNPQGDKLGTIKDRCSREPIGFRCCALDFSQSRSGQRVATSIGSVEDDMRGKDQGEVNRWVQLKCGIVCMVMVANLQYGWTL
jgi:hypothetical protein